MEQLHKKFSDDQVKDLLARYLEGKVKIVYSGLLFEEAYCETPIPKAQSKDHLRRSGIGKLNNHA